MGIVKALGNDRQGKLALWQVLARAIDQGSRLSAVRLAGTQAACDVLDLDRFCEDDLYANLDWLCANQAAIEDRLFRTLHPKDQPSLFLYDVTSSYLEGMHNALAAFGYNRDGKKGKKQIVIGLLCDEAGIPLSIEVFRGNTSDPKTFGSQVNKAVERFGCQTVTFVGDRGMIKSGQIADLPEGMHYITAITKPQIQKLLAQDVIQIDLFDETIAEIQTEECRYVLRRNPVRAEELAASRQDKKRTVQRFVQERNHYLSEHSRAHVQTALRNVSEKIEKLKLDGWLRAPADERTIRLEEDEAALAEESKLDGGYVLKTDLDETAATKETVHDRYKDLVPCQD